MHDPMTVAFEIRRPWRDRPSKAFPKGYRPSVVTIWHRDPNIRGDDDSCRWSFPKPPDGLVQKVLSDLHFLNRQRPSEYVEDESSDAVRRRLANVDPEGRYTREQMEAEGSVAWTLLWLNRVSFWDRGKPLSPRQLATALYSASFPGGRDDRWRSFGDHEAVARGLVRGYCQLVRPWWKHPRWHVHHWRIQIHPVQAFKRWVFSRCCRCGGRFAWGESPITDSWNGIGPRWFRGEPRTYHARCDSCSPSLEEMPPAGQRRKEKR